jgi:3-hydroxyacyl-CoA dehydrogenase
MSSAELPAFVEDCMKHTSSGSMYMAANGDYTTAGYDALVKLAFDSSMDPYALKDIVTAAVQKLVSQRGRPQHQPPALQPPEQLLKAVQQGRPLQGRDLAGFLETTATNRYLAATNTQQRAGRRLQGSKPRQACQQQSSTPSCLQHSSY